MWSCLMDMASFCLVDLNFDWLGSILSYPVRTQILQPFGSSEVNTSPCQQHVCCIMYEICIVYQSIFINCMLACNLSFLTSCLGCGSCSPFDSSFGLVKRWLVLQILDSTARMFCFAFCYLGLWCAVGKGADCSCDLLQCCQRSRLAFLASMYLQSMITILNFMHLA